MAPMGTKVLATKPPLAVAARERVRRSRAPLAVGTVAAAGTVAFLIPGAGRGYDLDSGLAVHSFIATRSIGDSFTKAFLLTNQVFFSFLDHLVYSASGAHSEAALRLLPISFTAIAIGLLAALLARRYGCVAALAGAAVMATNPLLAVEGSQVRGYSLVILCTIVTTAILLRDDNERLSRRARVAYAVAGAIGVATHLYMLVVLAIHAVVAARSRRRLEQLAIPWFASLLGLTAYAGVARTMRLTMKVTGRTFQPAFPRDLAVELLGGGVVAAIMLLPVVVSAGWWSRRDRRMQLAAAGVAGAVSAVWLIAPTYLYPRFWLWLVPVPAVAVAAAISRRPAVVLVAIAVVALQVHTAWPRLTSSSYPNRQAAQVFERVVSHHQTPCVISKYTALRLLGYTAHFAFVSRVEQLDRCEVVFDIGSGGALGARYLNASFPYRAILHAQLSGVMWSRVPMRCWASVASRGPCARPAPRRGKAEAVGRSPIVIARV